MTDTCKPACEPTGCRYDDAPLDCDVFPHIMDSVLQASSPPTLLAIRGLSSEMRYRVDGILASHITISNRPHCSSSPSYLDVSPHCCKLGFRPPIDLARTRIVDLVGPVGARPVTYRAAGAGKNGLELYLEYLSEKLVNVHTVRLRPDTEGRGTSLCPIQAKTVVAFAEFSEPESSSYPSIASVGPVPDSTERLVLNVAYEPRSWWLPRANLILCDVAHKPNLTNVAVLLSPTASSPGCGRSYGEAISGQWMGMMSSIVNLMSYTLPRVKFTLVGVEKLEPEWLGIEPDWHGSPPSSTGFFDFRNDTVVHLVIEAVETELRRRHIMDDEEIEEALSHITFMSRDKYEKSVNARQFELETVQ